MQVKKFFEFYGPRGVYKKPPLRIATRDLYLSCARWNFSRTHSRDNVT